MKITAKSLRPARAALLSVQAPQSRVVRAGKVLGLRPEVKTLMRRTQP